MDHQLLTLRQKAIIKDYVKDFIKGEDNYHKVEVEFPYEAFDFYYLVEVLNVHPDLMVRDDSKKKTITLIYVEKK